MGVSLNIRNLTSNEVQVQSLGRRNHSREHSAVKALSCSTHQPQPYFKSNTTVDFISYVPFQNQDGIVETTQVDLLFQPLEILETDILTPSLPQETLELKVVLNEQTYSLNLPEVHVSHICADSRTCNHNLTVFYSGHDGLLVLCAPQTKDGWMKSIKDDTPLSALSIPGTHNSPAHHKALPSVRCQASPVYDQFCNGVRFLDVRVQVRPNDPDPRKRLALVHSVFSVKLVGHAYLYNLLAEIAKFFKDYPDETILMSIKRDSGQGTDEQLSTVLKDLYAGDHSKWFTAPRIPYLGETRHKIVLIRRFNLDDSLKNEYGGAGWGIDASVWADNTPESTCPSGDICVQDYYSMLEHRDIDKKIEFSQSLLDKAAERRCDPFIGSRSPDEKHPLIINFITGSNLWKRSCWPERIAAKLNPHILAYLCTKHGVDPTKRGDGGTGIVVCDWVGHNGNWDLIKCIVAMNSRYGT